MHEITLYSLVESPTHPNFAALYAQLGLTEIRLTSSRKAMTELKKNKPDIVVAEFFYGYGNNYAGINLCNLDVFLRSLQKYAPQAKVIVIAMKEEREFVDKLTSLFPIHAVLTQPVSEADMSAILSSS